MFWMPYYRNIFLIFLLKNNDKLKVNENNNWIKTGVLIVWSIMIIISKCNILKYLINFVSLNW